MTQAMIVSYKIHPKVEEIFENHNIKLIKTEPHPGLPKEIQDHPDLVLLPIHKKKWIVDKKLHAYYENCVKDYGITLIPTVKSLKNTYPEDCLLNVGSFQNYLIGKKDIYDPMVLEYFKGKQWIQVKQGYGYCSMISFEDFVITGDKGIYKRLKEKNLKVYLLPQGKIALPGYDTGFLGGSYGMINPKKIVFYGDLSKYPYHKELEEILSKEKGEFLFPDGVDFIDRGSMINIY